MELGIRFFKIKLGIKWDDAFVLDRSIIPINPVDSGLMDPYLI